MKFTTSIRKIKTEFSLQHASSFGNIKVFLSYLEKIKLSEEMLNLSDGKAHNELFPLYRIFHFRRLQHDVLLKRFLGGRCPQHTLLYKKTW